MKHTSHFPILKDLGLSESEALVYELLLENGTSEARDLVTISGIGRGNVYNILSNLERLGLTIVLKGGKQRYQATDPSRLRELLNIKLENARLLEVQFSSALKDLHSAYSLSTGRPVIEVFEGTEGMKEALFHSLGSKTLIRTYLDVTAMHGPIVDINKGYVKKRIEKKIQKRIIVRNSPEARAFFKEQDTPYTEVAFVKDFPEGHASAMELYDDTVSILTLRDGKRISVLMHDADVFALHAAHFDFLWKMADERLALKAD